KVRAREEPEHAAHAELGARTRLLQARRRGARRPHLGSKRRRGEGQRLPLLAPARAGAQGSACDGRRRGTGVRVFLRTFGCRANHYDTEAVRAMLDAGGHTVVASAAEADVAVFNSCAVTAEAEAELRKVVRRAARERPELRSVVMGCAAALDDQRPSSLQARALPTVERVVPGADLVALADALDVPAELALRGTAVQSGTRALLRVQ